MLLLPAVVEGVRDKKFYDILGVPEDADDRIIKKAYKKQALKWHPDRHTGNKKKAEDRFKEVAAAYETLSDPEKRRMYDQFGEERLKQGGPGGPGGPGGGGFQFHGDPFEMFNMFFGGGGGGGGGGRQQFQFQKGGGGGGFQFGGMGGGFPGGMGGHPRQQQQHHGGSAGGPGGLYDDSPAVLQLDGNSFPAAGSSGWLYLVEFYAPWCGHCQQLAPKWKKVAESLKAVAKVAAVNCDDHKPICSARGVRGYPTIMALAPHSKSWQEYQGDRSAAALSSWATSLIGNDAVVLKKESDLSSFLSQCGSSSSSGTGTSSRKKQGSAAGASWGLCMVLVSSKSTVPSLWKALSVAYRGKAAFGFVTADAKGVLAQLGAAGELGSGQSSRVVSICNGDVRTAEAYSGTVKSEPLQRHISSYASGKKCAAQVVLDDSTNLQALKVGQLKALITAKGVDCSGCIEKADYVAALKTWLQQQKKQEL
ncbi:hypothetical protein OEZ85_000490 [Tetradesmus obliquus]|uniref:DnaJ homolog subfamily C member 10 n=1 Tax=Tetradesmus obliquus TaxID=3088 RepID=A0ABY8UIY4_TETOB|nr:hypothetical protein OEZ85_000490 [Tetradesmus obliquus]